jgi:hypothetical protein
MTRISALVLIAAIVAAPAASVAQTNAAPPSTNSAGTAQSSGAPNRELGVTSGTALGTGKAAPPPMPSSATAVNQENATIDRKLKSICRGC